MKSNPDCTVRSPDGKCRDPNDINRLAQSFGFALLDGQELIEARSLAASVLGEAIATAKSYQLVRQTYQAGVYGFREDEKLTGLSASFALCERGLEALCAGKFDAIELDLSHLALPGDTPAAYYGWGFLGATKRAAASVVLLSRAIHRRLFWATPTYTRAVTDAGMRACLSLGFSRAPGAEGALLWIAPNTFAPGLSP